MSKRGWIFGILAVGVIGGGVAAAGTVFVAEELNITPQRLLDEVAERGSKFISRKYNAVARKVDKKWTEIAGDDGKPSPSQAVAATPTGSAATEVAQTGGAKKSYKPYREKQKEADLASEAFHLWSEDGANARFYNAPAGLPWRRKNGDWRDADNKAQGKKPYAQKMIADLDKVRAETWDVTALVNEWLSGRRPNRGIMLRKLSGGKGVAVFQSRESKAKGKRPKLIVELAGGGKKTLNAAADTYTAASSRKVLGKSKQLKVGNKVPTYIRFNLGQLKGAKSVTRATLRLFTTKKQFGKANVGVFRADSGQIVRRQKTELGIAAKYPNDRGIGKDPNVILATDFESDSWDGPWKIEQKKRRFEPVSKAPKLKFEKLAGRALKIPMPKGAHLGIQMSYLFKQQLGEEPEEIYFRFYLRLADDWHPSRDGGKMPGIAGTYGKAGWGGRRATGKNGWSARGGFELVIKNKANPLFGRTRLGTYAYYADMPTKYGDSWSDLNPENWTA